MRYSTQPRGNQYTKGYGFLSFARKFVDKYGEKNNGHCNKDCLNC